MTLDGCATRHSESMCERDTVLRGCVVQPCVRGVLPPHRFRGTMEPVNGNGGEPSSAREDEGEQRSATLDEHDDLHAQRAENDAVRHRTEAALKALATDLEEVRAVSVSDSLDGWRADLASQMAALTEKLQNELEQYVPDSGGAYVEEERSAEGLLTQDLIAGPGTAGENKDLGSEARSDVMAELARREAVRAELLASLMR